MLIMAVMRTAMSNNYRSRGSLMCGYIAFVSHISLIECINFCDAYQQH